MRMRIWFVLASRKWEHSCSDPPQQRVAELDQIWIRLLHGQVPGLEEFFGAFACGAGEKTVRPNPLERSVPQRSKPVHLSSQLDRKSTRLNSSHVSISYAVFCL